MEILMFLQMAKAVIITTFVTIAVLLFVYTLIITTYWKYQDWKERREMDAD